jgi:uncharacterized membrane protein
MIRKAKEFEDTMKTVGLVTAILAVAIGLLITVMVSVAKALGM